MNPKDTTTYKELLSYVEQMEESANLLKNMIYNSLEDDGYNITDIEELHKKITKDDIENQSNETIQEIFKSVGKFDDDSIKNICRVYHEIEEVPILTSNEVAKKVMDGETDIADGETPEELTERMKKFDKNYETTKFDFMKKVLIHVFDQLDEIDKTYKDVDELKAQADGAVNEYVKYITSEEYLNKKKERLQVLKENADKCDDPAEKKKILELIDSIENSMNLTFIIDKLSKNNEREYRLIEENYFDSVRSNYNLERFRKKIVKFGYKEDIYSHFFNIEEKFLEEKYHVFNNLFLFYMIRFVAYSDPDNKKDKLYVQSLISNIANLVYHKFAIKEQEDNLLSIIREFLDNFEGSYDKFNEKNILHPNHPKRLAQKKQQENRVKGMVYQNLKEMGYEITQEIEDMSMDELRKFYDECLDESKNTNNESDGKLSEIIGKIKQTSVDVEKRESLKKEFHKYAEWTDDMINKFNTGDLSELEELVNQLKEDFENSSNDTETSDDVTDDSE